MIALRKTGASNGIILIIYRSIVVKADHFTLVLLLPIIYIMLTCVYLFVKSFSLIGV